MCGMCCVECVFVCVHICTCSNVYWSQLQKQIASFWQGHRYSCLRTYRKLEGRGAQSWIERFEVGVCLAPDSILAWWDLTLIQDPP